MKIRENQPTCRKSKSINLITKSYKIKATEDQKTRENN